MECYSAIKMNEIMPLAAVWTQLEIVTVSEVSQKEKDKCRVTSLTCGIYSMTQMNICKRKRLRDVQVRPEVAKGRRGGRGMHWEFEIRRCKLLHIEWINNKVLLYSTGNYFQYPVINHNGKECEKGYICMHN